MTVKNATPATKAKAPKPAPTKPRLNTVAIAINAAALEAEGYSLWRFDHSRDSSRKTFSNVPCINDAFENGSLKACISGSHAGNRFVYILARGTDIPFQTKGPKRLAFDDVDPGIVLRLALLSGDIAYYGNRDLLRGLSGVRPVWDSVQSYLKIVLDWKVVRETEIDGVAIHSLFPDCSGFRTHQHPWRSKKDRKEKNAPHLRDLDRHEFLFRPVIKAEKGKAKKKAKSAASAVYLEVFGARLKWWQPGDLLDGASVRNSKESSLCWAHSDASKDVRSRSAAIEGVIEALPKSPFASGIALRFVHQDQADARVTTASGALIRNGWRGVRDVVFAGKRLVVLDLRLDRRNDLGLLLRSVGFATAWLGLGPVALRSLDVADTASDVLEERIAEQIAAWHAQDGADVAWLCLVDNRKFLDGKPDTKRIAYRIAEGRPLQSICKSKAFLEDPVAKRLKREQALAKRRADEIAAGKAVKPFTPKPPEPDDGPFDVGPTVRMAVVSLALDIEIQAGKLLRPRPWLPAAAGYLFVDTVKVDGDEQCVWLSIGADGAFSFGGPGSALQAHAQAEQLGKRLLVCDTSLSVMLPDALNLRATNMRAMPPSTGGKVGWLNMASVCTYPDLHGYTATVFDNPSSGSYEKGVTLRVLDNEQSGDLANVATMCLEPLVRVGQSTVIPAPFQILREWAGANVALDIDDGNDDDDE